MTVGQAIAGLFPLCTHFIVLIDIQVNAVSTIMLTYPLAFVSSYSLRCRICLALVTSGHGGGKWHIPFVRTSFSRTRLHKSLLLGRDQSQCLGHVSFVLLRLPIPSENLISRGSWFALLNRVILSCCWYGVQAWYGGQMVKIMIGSIWREFCLVSSS